jgi:hypothetical protein
MFCDSSPGGMDCPEATHLGVPHRDTGPYEGCAEIAMARHLPLRTAAQRSCEV